MFVVFYFLLLFCCLIKTEVRTRKINEQSINQSINQIMGQTVVKPELDYFVKEFHNSFEKVTHKIIKHG